jgi:hypothetical protein
MDTKLSHTYETLSDLIQAYRTGELDERTPVLIAPDATAVYLPQSEPADETSPKEKAFDGGSAEALLEQALDMLDVPWKPV